MIHIYNKFFTPAECEAIIELGDAAESTYIKAGTGESKNLKELTVGWIDCLPNSNWIFGKLHHLFTKWPITRLERLQFTTYRKGGCCDWHIDYEEETSGGAARSRVANAIVQLSGPDDYTGGELEMRIKETVFKGPIERGSVLVLDKAIWHRVAPLESGVRKSLVSWGLGNDT